MLKVKVPPQMENRLRAFLARKREQLAPVEADIGVIENSVGVDRDGKTKSITVAEEAFINCHGDPARNIPPRDYQTLAITRYMKIWDQQLTALLKSGDQSLRALEKVAIVARDAVKETISNYDGPFPNNAPATIARKGRDQPLVDMGDLLRSIQYEIRRI